MIEKNTSHFNTSFNFYFVIFT